MENEGNIMDSQVQDLFLVHENNFCFECGSCSNEWASVNNGICLCSACAGIHKGFGLDISMVRSLNNEAWSPMQLEMMRRGGNDKLKEFFERYNISMERPFDVKYRTKAAYYYREKLRALAEGHPVPDAPSLEEGSEVVENSSDFVPIGQTSPNKKNDKSFFGKAKSFKVDGTQLKKDVAQGFKTFGNTMAVGAKSVATGAKTMATKLNDKMKDTNFKDDAKIFGNKVAVGAKSTAGKLAVVSKKGYVGAVGFFKNLGNKKNKGAAGSEEINDENVNTANIALNAGAEGTVVEDQKPSISL